MNDQYNRPITLQTAVLFLVFKRPHTTAKVFEAIRQVKPPRLYVAADGPRSGRTDEADKVNKVRKIAMDVDWSCEVKTLFRGENLGCKIAVSDAISWFFEHEEQGIILEDDCLPHPDFFKFCELLLEYYADDKRVSVITGNNFQNGIKRGEGSYYFSKYNHCWGWATWRNAWKNYQGHLPFWSKWSKSSDWRKKKSDFVERRYWASIFDRVQAGQINSWAYPWTASLWYIGGLTATPNVNLVSNIGFDTDATHTASVNSEFAEMATSGIGEIIHPREVVQDEDADRYVFDHHFGGRSRRFPWWLLRLLRRTAIRIYHFLR